MAVLLYAEAGEQRGGITLRVPSFQLGELLLQLGGTDTVLIGEILLGINGVFLLHYVPKHRMAAQHCLHNRAVVELEVVLLQHRESLAGA